MKYLLCLVSFLVVFGTNCSAQLTGQWTLKSPLNSPRYQELMNSLFPQISNNRYSRIYGGQNAYLGQFPHHALLETIDKTTGDRFICGGSIITHNWILTAAHCLENIARLQVYVGIIDRVQGPAVWGMEVSNQNDMIIHENFNGKNLINDIALVRLISTIKSDPMVKIIELPKRSEVSLNLENKIATVAGFGRYLDTSGPSANLRWAQMSIVANSVCERIFGKANVLGTNICLDGSQGRSTCSGDSGGSLTVDLNGRKVIVGVVSFGAASGCSLGYPTVFTRVSGYLDWISQKTNIQIL